MRCPDSDVGHVGQVSNTQTMAEIIAVVGNSSLVGHVGRVGHQLRFSGKVSNCPTCREMVTKSRMALGKMVLEESSNTRPTVQQHGYVHDVKYGKLEGTIHRNAEAMLVTSLGASRKVSSPMHNQSIPDTTEETTHPIVEQNVVFLDQEVRAIPFSVPYGYECIYFLESDGIFKIGRSEAPRSRIFEIGRMNPRPLTLLHYVVVKKVIGGEAALHIEFREHRLHGEWFRLTHDDAYRVYAAMNDLVRRSTLAPTPRLPRPKHTKTRRQLIR